jgi:oligopeptide/dipeptide ABC transporter ATP-binding protein
MVKDLREKLYTSFIWITHDLGLISGMVDRICVMYAGYIIEKALVDDVYYDPRHPYTLALLGCIPKKDENKSRRLTCINGSPPDLAVKPTCCPFISRCKYSIERCKIENPPLTPVPGADLESQHRAACWVDIRDKV